MLAGKGDIPSRVRTAVLAASEKKVRIKDSHAFIADLGFDSLRMVALSLALEDEFQRPLLLNDWLSSASDPSRLTVASLCDYVSQVYRLVA